MAEILKELTAFTLGAFLCTIAGYSIARSLEEGFEQGRLNEDEAIFVISRHEDRPVIITWIKGGNQ